MKNATPSCIFQFLVVQLGIDEIPMVLRCKYSEFFNLKKNNSLTPSCIENNV